MDLNRSQSSPKIIRGLNSTYIYTLGAIKEPVFVYLSPSLYLGRISFTVETRAGLGDLGLLILLPEEDDFILVGKWFNGKAPAAP